MTDDENPDAPEWLTRARSLERFETQVVRTNLQHDTLQRRLRALHSDILVRAADKPGFYIIGRTAWPHTRFKPRARPSSGVNPIERIKRAAT